MTKLSIREMQDSDADKIATLSAELSYPTLTEHVSRRFRQLASRDGNGMFVAESENRLLGWIHVYSVYLLETDGYAEVGGIVVTEAERRKGVGSALLKCGEKWACERGHKETRLRSGLQRGEAHQFYLACGYEQSKASYMFRLPFDKAKEGE